MFDVEWVVSLVLRLCSLASSPRVATPLTAGRENDTLTLVDIHDEVAALKTAVKNLTGRVEGMEELIDVVDELNERLKQDARERGEGERIVWFELHGENAQRVLADLWKWMSTVLVHYPRVVGMLRPCWYRHPASVQALLDTWDGWRATYRASAGNHPIDWAQGDLPRLEEQLARDMGRCTSVAHEPMRIPLPELDNREVRDYLDNGR